MWSFLLAALIGAATSVVLDLRLAWRWRRAWVQRGIEGPLNTRLNTALRLALPAAIAPLFTLVYSANALGTAYVAAAVWMGVVFTTTDLASCKIPREPAWVTLALGAIAVACAGNLAGALSAGVALVLVGLVSIVTVLLTRGGLGSGDVRMLLALTPLAVWVGFWPVLASILFGSLLQIPLRFALKRWGNYSGPGLPFGPALLLGMVFSIVFFGHPGTPTTEWFGIL
jgi:hypothetical protein